ncbi:hypothetical protein BATMR_32920 [Bacillus altitudinis]|nr:hypothetical protein BATMR_32920 [Bacillus altitudinis]
MNSIYLFPTPLLTHIFIKTQSYYNSLLLMIKYTQDEYSNKFHLKGVNIGFHN